MAKIKKNKRLPKLPFITDEMLSPAGHEHINGIIQSAYMKMQNLLVSEEVALPGRTVKTLATIEIKGWDENGGERLIENELIALLGKELLETNEGYNTVFPFVPCGVVKSKTENRGIFYTVFEVTAETEDEFDLSIAEYRSHNGAFYLHFLVYTEGIKKRVPLEAKKLQYAAIENFFLSGYSRERLGDFSDAELKVLSQDIPAEEAAEHSSVVMNYMMSVFRCVNFIKNYASSWPSNSIPYWDNDFYVIKNWREDEEQAPTDNGTESSAAEAIKRIIDTEPAFSIIPQNSIGKLLSGIASKGITIFYSAVGFAYKSGLVTLEKIFENPDCQSELIIGALQNYAKGKAITKMDRATAAYINKNILNGNVALYTYTPAFYHGKFYYLSNSERAYIFMGSSNISRAAFADSFELDALYITEKGSETDIRFLEWYHNLRDKCDRIEHLDCDLFYEHSWESELDAYSLARMRRVSTEEMISRLPSIHDEDTRYRVELWMKHEPHTIYENHGVSALRDYTMFVYPQSRMAVFECLLHGNAYYVFRYTDSVENLLAKIGKLSKGHIQLLSDDLLDRGYHSRTRSTYERKINGYFTN